MIFLLPFLLKAQNAIIGGVINSYASGIHQISSTQLKINQIALFSVNDTILIYQAQGAIPVLTNNSSFGDILNIGNAGNYDFSIIQSIDGVNKIITLSCPLLNNYDDNLFQVVKVKTYTNATVNTTLTCDPWDGTKGGILVMFVNGTLTLNANIDVTGKGFRGANSPVINSLNKCSNEASGGIYSYYYTVNGYDSAGLKGEGIAQLPLNFARGRGKFINGGGGGNGINSAGGGGSNAGAGGNGGRESDACILVNQNYGGIGGLNILSTTGTVAQKLFMGGGGGTGTYEQYSNDVTKGGNGGGIIIIIANNIVANNKQITANGESVNLVTTYESAGGGGGGGSVVFISPIINGNILLNALGGNGGSSNNITCRGSGGGGGGGVVYYSTFSGPSPTINVSKGLAGNACSSLYKGTDGANGMATNNFQLRLNCLLSNNIIGSNHSVCPGIQPHMLTGDESPFYTSYLWQCSTNQTTWNNCPGVNNQANYQPSPLSQTTYFRRIVLSSDGSVIENDTSNVVTITVVPLQLNIQINHVNCYGQNTGSADISVTGGSGSYSYNWSNGNTTHSINNVTAGTYTVTISDNMGCSVIDTILINQPPILTSSISQTNVLCNGGNNGTATVSASGGVPPYTYHWSNGQANQTATGLSATTYNVTVYDSHSCTVNNSVTITQPQPLTINTTITNTSCSYSCNGSITVSPIGGTSPYTINPANLNNLCAGNYVITVTDAHNCSITISKTISYTTQLQNNNISLTQSQACANDSITITGSVPSGAGTISYQWKYSPNGFDWYAAPNINYNQNYNWIATSSSYFKRVILGGGCSDTSNTVHIDVTTINNQIYTADSVYCANETPLPIEGNNENGYTYQWLMNTGSGWTNTGITSYIITPPPFNNMVRFKRVVYFNGCVDSSNIITLYKINTLTANHIYINNIDTIKQYCGFAQGNIDGVVSGAIGTLHFIWQISYDLNQWELLPDTTVFATFTLNDYSSHRYYYYRRIVEQDGCFDTSNVVTIDLLPPIIGNLIQSTLGLGSTAHVCQGSVVWLGSINVNPAGGSGSYTYHWVQSQDSINWNSALGPNQFQAYSTPAIFDTTFYARIVTSGVCIDTSNTFAIYPIILPNNQISIEHTHFCEGAPMDTIIEVVNTQGQNVSYQWQWLNNGNWENIPGATSACYLPNFAIGQKQYRRIIQIGNCSSNSNEISIIGNVPPSISYSLVENDSLCLTPNLWVHIHTHIDGTSPWNIQFTVNGTIYNVNQTQADSEYTININQPLYIISITQLSDASGCNGTIPTDSIIIHGFSPVSAHASSMELCGNSATLQAQNPSPGIGTWTVPTHIGINDIHHPNAQVQSSNYGTFTLIWEVKNGPCIDTNHIQLTFYEPPQIPNAGPDIIISENIPITMQASIPNTGQGTWQVIEGQATFSDLHNPNTTVSNFAEGINILRWTVSNGNCPVVFDDIAIELKSLFIPEGFSPNGDGTNDHFVIHGIEPTDNYKLTVFNRWGNVVYEKEPYANDWDGKDLNSHVLPDDTYFYIVQKNNKVKASGYIILKR
ncbi:MAG: gliding motility-associated C-terminal domain-containing protein [Bacteroidales bacterium]|nr:gliding motility-associated C-terminal domain-containing protein [Bacteroidales bacterium]